MWLSYVSKKLSGWIGAFDELLEHGAELFEFIQISDWAIKATVDNLTILILLEGPGVDVEGEDFAVFKLSALEGFNDGFEVILGDFDIVIAFLGVVIVVTHVNNRVQALIDSPGRTEPGLRFHEL